MVYGFVLIAILCLAIKGYCGKKTSTYMRDTGNSFLFNLLRMIFCVVIGIVLIFLENSQNLLNIEMRMVLICLLAGLSNAAFLAGWLLAIQKNAMVSVDVTLTIGSLLPAVLCYIFFDEAILWQKMIGYVLIILATVILSKYSKSIKGVFDVSGVLFLVIASLGDGLTGFCQQLYKQYYSENGNFTYGVLYPKSVFNFYTYVFTAQILLIVWLIYVIGIYFKSKKSECTAYIKGSFSALKKSLPHIVIMAICLYAATYFQTAATSDYGMPSQVLYPLIKGSCLITASITSMLFCGEKPNRRSLIGTGVAMLGIIALNIL